VKKKALMERMGGRTTPHLRLDRRRAGRYAAPITDAPYPQDGPAKANASNTRAPGRRKARWAPEVEFEFEVWQEFNINEAMLSTNLRYGGVDLWLFSLVRVDTLFLSTVE
jgi:hypothetical protein